MMQAKVRAVFRCPLCKTQNWLDCLRIRVTPDFDLFCVDCNRKTGQFLVNVRRRR